MCGNKEVVQVDTEETLSALSNIKKLLFKHKKKGLSNSKRNKYGQLSDNLKLRRKELLIEYLNLSVDHLKDDKEKMEYSLPVLKTGEGV
ncbi:hypothetical protein D3C73_1393650 [compost metagenome]